jgi:hypothetical protein
VRESYINNDRHFRVVRYHPHFSHGLMEDVLGDNLTLQEAEEIAAMNPPVLSDEEVIILDLTKHGLEAELTLDRPDMDDI